tara:strand:+ start:416 stop:880 length:465 start_codon:yes stop_codon:yes gene_type:complete
MSGIVCLLASFASIITFSVSHQYTAKDEISKLRALLNDEQRELLASVKRERGAIAFEGLLVGLVAVLPFVFFRRICFGVLILFVVQSVYYLAKPKSIWLLNHLTKREQIDQWLIVYQKMRVSGLRASLLSAAFYLLVALVLSSFTRRPAILTCS